MRALLLLALFCTTPAAAAAAGRGGMLATGPAPAAWDRGDGRSPRIALASSTDWRFLAIRAADDSIVSFAPLWQTFRLSIRDDGPRASLAWESAFRGGADLLRGGFEAEVLHAYFDIAPSSRWGLVRIGRQTVPAAGTAGVARMDGVRAFFTLHRLGLEAWAGIALRSRTFIDRAPGPLETSTAPAPPTWGRDFTWGVAAFLSGHRSTQLRVAFSDRLRDGALSRRTITLDASQAIRERLVLRFSLLADLLQRRVAEIRAGVEGRPLPWLGAGFGYEHFRPSFDADAIWSVFATDAFDAFDVRGSLRAPGGAVVFYVSGGGEIYPAAVTIDGVPRDEVKRVASMQRAGITVAPLRWLRVAAEERMIGGVAGSKWGVGGSVTLAPWDGKLQFVARGDAARYAFDLQPGLKGSYGSVGGQLIAQPLSWMRVRVGLDRVFTPWIKGYLTGSCTLDLAFGAWLRGGMRPVLAEGVAPIEIGRSAPGLQPIAARGPR